MGILPLPLALGFLFAVLHDVSYTRAEIQEKSWIGAAQHPTLRDQAVLYHFALQAVHSGGASENFWSTVRTIEDQRIAWQQHKPWVWMFNARPVGISALDWCMATRTGDPATRIAYCAKGVDEEVWFTRMPD